jgi:tetratricopeptide (TPR) repeat protein
MANKLSKFPSEHSEFEPLAQRAFQQWAPGAEWKYHSIRGGHSGAAVIRVDVHPVEAGRISSGQYIVKLGRPSKYPGTEPESVAHERARQRAPIFAEHHLPRLIESHQDDEGEALLYDIAGGSFARYAPAAAGQFRLICARLCYDLLAYWVDRQPGGLAPAHVLLERWLEYRLDPAHSDLPRIVEKVLGPEDLAIEGKLVVVNPLRLYQLLATRAAEPFEYLDALIHGDLHCGNLLLLRTEPDKEPYHIIDFALSRVAPAGFDQAYLEVALLMELLDESDPAPLLGVLEGLESGKPVTTLPNAESLLACLTAMRSAVLRWKNDYQNRRHDVVDRQMILARVAAGLNWAKKPISERNRRLALAYAGFAARRYLEVYEPALWEALGPPARQSPADPPGNDATDDEVWNELWAIMSSFSPSAGRFLLVAGAQGDDPRLRALGQLPWSVIIDIDPSSEQQGLFRQAEPILAAHRMIHVFGKSRLDSSFARGTAWMMAAGWPRTGEPVTPFAQWRYDYLEPIRQLIDRLNAEASPGPIKVLVLPGATLDRDAPMGRLAEVVSVIEERTRGKANTLVLGRSPLPLVGETRCRHLPLDVTVFLARLEATVGVNVSTEVAQIPGKDGALRSIPMVSLRALQENLQVLHTRLRHEPDLRAPDVAPDSFWRGHPPTWADFLAGADIQRTVHDALLALVREKLVDGRSGTIPVHHNPGAGGSTLALRIAWDLHREYPTVVLREQSRALAARLETLFRLAERTVLLVAEASDLTDAARKDLQEELARTGCRVVLLYVRRVLSREPTDVCLFDPMEPTEADAFLKAYQRLTSDPRRRGELARITSESALERYRTPFFYGLITFEKEFVSIERYVGAHLQGARSKARSVLQYLAMITIYSNTGLHESLLRRLMGVSDDAQLELPELLGDGPARLVTTRGDRLRLLHQVIAEEVLVVLSGGAREDAKRELHYLARDFIRDVASVADPESVAVQDLFRQLFVDRQGAGHEAEDRQDFAPLIETADGVGRNLGHTVLAALTEYCPADAHFWNHLGRHQLYRLKRNIAEAEKYLDQAIRLSPGDALHYHTRGLIRRSQLREFIAALPPPAVHDLLAGLTPLFDRAVADFDEARRLDPESAYSYITHVQTILDVVGVLTRASGVTSIARIAPAVASWVQDKITTARSLLFEVRHKRTVGDQDPYLTRCAAELQSLYGNLDEAIRIWEVAHAGGRGTVSSRRALTDAYLARAGQRWSALQKAELRAIVTLMERNLASASRCEDDYRIWFEAYKALPEFDIEDALDRLRLWAERFPSWRPWYYSYVLHFSLWFDGRSGSLEGYDRCLDRCRELARGRARFSHLWLSQDRTPCRLLSSDDLGEWDRTAGFWVNARGLRRINGVISDGQLDAHRGIIRIGRRVEVPFRPGNDFFAHQDENRGVSFLLGFSALGPRAWVVNGETVEDGDPVGPRGALAIPVEVEAPALADESRRDRVRALKLDRVLGFVRDLVVAQTGLGTDVTTADLCERIDATFGVDGLLGQLGRNLEQLLGTTPGYDLVRDGETVRVRLHAPSTEEPGRAGRSCREVGLVIEFAAEDPARAWGLIQTSAGRTHYFRQTAVAAADRHGVARGSRVEFTPGQNARGPIATAIRVCEQSPAEPLPQREESSAELAFGRLPPPRPTPPRPAVAAARTAQREPDSVPAMRAKARELAIRFVRETAEQGKPARQADLGDRLAAAIPGEGRLVKRLGYSTLTRFLAEVPELICVGDGADRIIRLHAASHQVLQPKPAPPGTTRHPPPPPPKRDDELRKRVLAEIVRIVATQPGQRLLLVELGSTLGKMFPGDRKLANRLGHSTLSKFLAGVPGFQIEDGHLVIVPQT